MQYFLLSIIGKSSFDFMFGDHANDISGACDILFLESFLSLK